MNDRAVLSFGALLHDVGKIVYRGWSEQGTHSRLGASFISREVAALNDSFAGEDGAKVIEQIRYHHAKEIKAASSLPDDSLAYITYFADNISAGMDRKNEGDEECAAVFDRKVKLRKIFNILNGHSDDGVIEHEDYNAIRERLKRELADISIEMPEVNSLINLLEATTSAVPSSTNMSELVDVSLFDHAKTTAGIALCIYDYLSAHGIENYRESLFDRRLSPGYYEKQMFMLCSLDISGIQSFIYNISGTGALKQLRARSLYLEIMLEHIADEILSRLGLSRANLLYTGGGHAYLLLPNTDQVKKKLLDCQKELEDWLIENYRTDLFVASACIECSANDLANEGEDKSRYPMLYRRLSEKLSDAKASRYDAGTLRRLNFAETSSADSSRECSECHRSDNLVSDDKCPLCAALGEISRDLMRKDVFVIERADAAPCSDDISNSDNRFIDGKLALPFSARLSMYTREEYVKKKPRAVRVYTKNWDMGINLATYIWMGDYCADMGDKGISAYAKSGTTLDTEKGIERLGVLRADVDNLGTTFLRGIPFDKVSISRTATLSRSLGYFFKHKINEVLERGRYQAQIIYSGGDDLFIVGNWSDLIYAAIDIRSAFNDFMGNDSLSISAGLGMYDAKYPIARMAEEAGDLEDAAKMHVDSGSGKEKNAIALWDAHAVFSWDEFSDSVEPRMREVKAAFDENEKGKAFIYRLVALLRAADDAISIPRLAYLLARSFEDDGAHGEETCMKFYNWAMNEKERKYLITALEWYVYSIRERN